MANNIEADLNYARGCYQQAAAAMHAPARLRGAVRRMLRSPEQNGTEHRQLRGRFDRRALVRASMGRQDVYTRRFHVPGQNVALCLLVDLSSSMRGSSIDAACALAVALAKAAEQAGAAVEVLGFHQPTTSMHTTATLIMLKEASERTSSEQTQAQLGAMVQLANSGTALAPAIVQCSERLAANLQATRRMLMVLSDGECSYGKDTVKLAVRMAQQQHATEVIAFGLGNGMSAESFANMFGTNVVHVSGSDLDQLDHKAFDELARKLERAAGC